MYIANIYSGNWVENQKNLIFKIILWRTEQSFVKQAFGELEMQGK